LKTEKTGGGRKRESWKRIFLKEKGRRNQERDRQLLERKRGETEGVKHHGRARDRK
jgi:hypothetical protein